MKKTFENPELDVVTMMVEDILYGIHNYGIDMLPYSNLLLS